MGQGKGQPNKGLGIPAMIIIASIINNTPAIIKSHFDRVNMTLLLSRQHPFWIDFAHTFS